MSSSVLTQLKVGLTSIIAIVILFGGVMWVKKYNPLEKKDEMSVFFQDGKGITAGDPVLVAGIKVGEITGIGLNDEGKALVRFVIEATVPLKSDCAFYIKDVGLMGDKALVVVPGSSEIDLDKLTLHEGLESFDIGDLMDRANDVMLHISSLSAKLDNDLDIAELTASIRQTLEKLQQAVAAYEEIAAENREPLTNSIKSFESSAGDIQQFIQRNDKRVENTLDSIQKTSDHISLTMQSVAKMSAVVDTLSAYLNSGDGTLAKFVKTDTLYEELRRTNANIDSFVTDFKRNPGKYTKDMQFKIRLF